MNIKRKVLFLFCLTFTHLLADGNHKMFNLGDLQLESGATLTNAQLSYVTHGTLNEEKNNLIVVPSAYLGDHHGFDFLIKKGDGARSRTILYRSNGHVPKWFIKLSK